MPRNLAEPQKHDHANNGECTKGEDTTKGSEFGAGQNNVFAGLAFHCSNIQSIAVNWLESDPLWA